LRPNPERVQDRNAALIEETEAATESLKDRSKKLLALLDRFQVA
jgi:methyl-accepting chemotaxis protein